MRPPQAIEPGPGQESVWDYPRPPRLERSAERVVVRHGGVVVADTDRPWRLLETSQAPAYYLPTDDVALEYLRESSRHTWCEWKGEASYFDLVIGETVTPSVAWTYRTPTPAFIEIAGCIALYPQLIDECSIDGEVVQANEGGFYGGWVTSKVVGPFKGAPGTRGW